MHILRGLGVIFALGIAFVISLLTKIDFTYILAAGAFILAVDTKVTDFISAQYLKAVYESLEEQTKDNKNDSDRT